MKLREILQSVRKSLKRRRSASSHTDATYRLRSHRPVLEVLEDRICPDAVSWIATTSGYWNNASNWLDSSNGQHRVPTAADDVTINQTGVTVTVNDAESVNSVTASTAIALASGGTLTVGTLTVPGAFSDTSTVTLSGGTLADAAVQSGTVLQGSGGATLSGVTLAGTLNDNVFGGSVTITNGLTLANGPTLNSGLVDISTIASLNFSGTQALSGDGEILFTGGNANSQLNLTGSGSPLTLTIGANITIDGFDASLNAGSGAIDNLGTVSVGSTNTTQTIPSGGKFTLNGAWTNDGSWQATNAGTLALDGAWTNAGTIGETSATLDLGGTFTVAALGTYTRTAGTINLTGTLNNTGTTLALTNSTGSWQLDGGTIAGGTVTTTGTAQLTGSGSGATLSGVTLAGTLNDNVFGGSVTITNGLTLNSGLVDISTIASLNFSGTQALSGSDGEVLFTGGNQNSQLNLTGSGSPLTLTIGANITIDGFAGSLNAGSGAIDNFGTVSVGSTNTTQTIPSGGTITLNGAWTNNGSWQATNAGTLALDGAWTNAGTIGETSATLDLGGTFTVAELGTYTRTAGTINLTGTLNNTGTTLALTNSTGSWQLDGGTIAGGTVTTTGTAQLTGSGNGGTLSGVTLAGTLTDNVFSDSVTITNGLTLNSGLVDITTIASLNFSGTQALSGSGGEVLFTGGNSNSQLSLTGSGSPLTLTIGANITIDGFNATLTAGSGAIDNFGTVSVGSTNTTQTIPSGGTITLNGAWTNSGTMEASNSGTLTVKSTTNYNSSTSTLTGGTWDATSGGILRLIGANIATNAATILIDGASSHIYSDPNTTNALAGFTSNVATGSFTIQNGANLSTTVAFGNAGTVTIGSSSAFTLGGNEYVQTGGTTVLAGGTLGALVDQVVIGGGTLSGPGTIGTNLTNEAEVDLGSTPGTLNIVGSYNQSSVATLTVQVGGTAAGQFDQVNVEGSAALGGTLTAELANGFTPSAGQTFPVVTFGTLNGGSYATFNSPTYFDGSPVFSTQYTAQDVNLLVNNAPAAPATPSNFVVTAVTASSVAFSWTDNDPSATSYQVEEAVGAGSTSFAPVPGSPFGANTTSATVTGLTSGTIYQFEVLAVNAGGASAPLDSGNIQTLISTSTSVSANFNPLVLNDTGVGSDNGGGDTLQSVLFTATVSNISGTADSPTGSIDFVDTTDDLDLGTVSLINGIATVATFPPNLGAFQVVASYLPTGNFAGSQGSLTEGVEAGTLTSVSASPAPGALGQPVTLTASVSSEVINAIVPTGTVAFFLGTAGGTSLGMGTLVNGSASVSTGLLTLGSNTIVAVYNPTADFAGSQGSAMAIVDRTAIWTGAAGDGIWDTADNWSPNSVPLSSDDVQILANLPADGVIALGPTDVANNLIVSVPLTLSGGKLAVGGMMTDSKPLTLENSAMLSVQGSFLLSAAMIDTGSTLSGQGTVLGDTVNDGELDTGSVIGRLNVEGNYVQGATGALTAKIAGPLASEMDQFDVAGTATLDGTLNVNLMDNFIPEQDEMFSFLDLPQTTAGGFANFNSPTNNGATVLHIVNDPGGVGVVGNPPPPSVAVSYSAEPTWQSEGPASISNGGNLSGSFLSSETDTVAGAINEVAVDPNKPNRLVVGTVNGGVWETEDANDLSPSWVALTDNMPSLSIGGMAISPLDGNTLFAGTADFSSGGSDGGPKVGLYRSTNNGANWNIYPLPQPNQNIARVIAEDVSLGTVNTENVLVLATNGVYLSTNGGQTFGTGPTLAGKVSDLVADGSATAPGLPSVFYAAVPGTGVYISEDSGQTWTLINGNLPSASLKPSTRIDLTVDSNGAGGSTIFAALSGPAPKGVVATGYTNVYRSVNGGANWTFLADVGQTVPAKNAAGVVVPTFVAIGGGAFVANPNNPNVVFISGGAEPNGNALGLSGFPGIVFQVTYAASGSSFAAIVGTGTADGSAPHADSRYMVFDDNGNLLYSCDGGLYRFIEQGFLSDFWMSVNGDIEPTEFYSVSYDPVSGVLIGGAQDIGSPEQTAPGSTQWSDVEAADGMFTAVDSISDPGFSIRYTDQDAFQGFQRQTYTSSNTLVPGSTHTLQLLVNGTTLLGLLGGNETIPQIEATLPAPPGAKPGATGSTIPFVPPYVINSVDPTRMLIGTNYLYESFDQGDTFTALGGVSLTASGFVPTNPIGSVNPSGTALAAYDPIVYGGNQVEVVDGNVQNVPNANLIWVGGGGNLWLRTSGTGAPSQVTTYPGSAVEAIAVDPNDWHIAYILDTNSRVWRTTDAGATKTNWTNLTLNPGALALAEAAEPPNGTTTGGTALRSLVVYDPTPFTKGATAVVLVGGFGGVYRLLPGAGAAWGLYGKGMPNVLVTSLQFAPLDTTSGFGDELVAGTFGRGAWVIFIASATLTLPSQATITATNATIVVRQDPAIPANVQVLVQDPTQPTSGNLVMEQPWALVSQITIDGNQVSANEASSVNTGALADTIDIQDVKAGTSVDVELEYGTNTVNVGYRADALATVLGPVTVNGKLGTESLNIDDQQDAYGSVWTISDTGASVQQDLPNAPLSTINYSGMNSITMNGGPLQNAFIVTNTPGLAGLPLAFASPTLTLNTGQYQDGNTVAVYNTGENSTLKINNGGPTTTAVIKTGPGSNTYIYDTASADTIVLGDDGQPQDQRTSTVLGIQGAVILSTKLLDTDTLQVDDIADPTSHTGNQAVTVTNGSIDGLAPGNINYGPNTLANLFINGGSGGTTWNVQSTEGPAPILINLDNKKPGPTPVAPTTTTTINCSGYDTINVGNAGSVQGIQGALNINGNELPELTLSLDDHATTYTAPIAVGINNASITGLAPAVINYEVGAAHQLTVQAGMGGTQFTVASMMLGPTKVSLSALGMANSIVGPDTGPTWQFQQVNGQPQDSFTEGIAASTVYFSGMGTITGGSGNDEFQFNGGGFAGTIDGGLGTNTLDFSQATSGSPLAVSLEHDGSLDGVAGSSGGVKFDNIAALIGNTYHGFLSDADGSGYSGAFTHTLSVTGFDFMRLNVPGDFSGSLLASTEGSTAEPILGSISVGGTVKAGAIIKVNFLASFTVTGDMDGKLYGYGNDTVTNVPTIKTITVGGNVGSAAIIYGYGFTMLQFGANFGGILNETGTPDFGDLTIAGSFLSTALIVAASAQTLDVSGDFDGRAIFSGPVSSFVTGGSLNGTMSAFSILDEEYNGPAAGHLYTGLSTAPPVYPTSGDVAGLIQAINQANMITNEPNIIDLVPGSTYVLTTVDNSWYGPNGLPAIASNITINGNINSDGSISDNGAVIERSAGATPFRMFYVSGGFDTLPAGTLTLTNVTLEGGLAQGGNGGAGQIGGGGGAGLGGAIFNQGILNLSGVTFTENTAQGGVGGIHSDLYNNGGGGGGGLGGDGGNDASKAVSLNADSGGGGGGFATAGAAGTASSGGSGGNGTNAQQLGGTGGAGQASGNDGNLGGGGGGGGEGGGNAGNGGVGGGGGGGGFFGIGGDGGFGGGGGGGEGQPEDAGVNGGNGGFGGGGAFFGASLFGGGYLGDDGSGGSGAGMGGAIFNMSGLLNMINSTLTVNTARGGQAPDNNSDSVGGAGYGGAIFNLNGTATLINDTIVGNVVLAGNGNSADGDDLYNLALDVGIGNPPTATVTLTNDILAGTGNNDVVSNGGYANQTQGLASITSLGTNLIQHVASGTVTGSGKVINGDPVLGPLQDNGGPTPTMEVLAGSPLLQPANFGLKPTQLSNGVPTTDQRGVNRGAPAGSMVLLGAYQATDATHFGFADFPTVVNAGVLGFFTISAQDPFNKTVYDYAGMVSFQVTGDEAGTVPQPSALTNGTGTFADSINTAGVQSLIAGDGTILSNVFVAVEPAAGSQTGASDQLIADASASPQDTTVNTQFQFPLKVQVTDGNGNGLDGESVTFTMNSDNGASGSFVGYTGNTTTVTTAGGGYASLPVLANGTADQDGTPGYYTVTATFGSLSATFDLTNDLAAAPPPPPPDHATELVVVSGNGQSATEGTTFGQFLKIEAIDGANGHPVDDVPINFQTPATGPSVTFQLPSTAGHADAFTGQDGTAVSTQMTANGVAGSVTITAIDGADSSVTPAVFTLTINSPAAPVTPNTMTYISGDNISTAVASTQAQNPLEVQLLDGSTPVPNWPVTFTPTPGSTGADWLNTAPVTVNTDSNGDATLPYTANLITGTYSVTASATGSGSSTLQHKFQSLTNTDAPAKIAGSGSFQATVNTDFAMLPQVTVTGTSGKGVAGVTVYWTAGSFPGGITSASFPAFPSGLGSSTTNSSGVATSPAILASKVAGTWTLYAGVEGQNIAGNSQTFAMTNVAGPCTQLVYVSGSNQSATVNTAFSSPLVVEAEDQYGNGVNNVAVTFKAPTSGASATLSLSPTNGKTTTVNGQAGIIQATATANKVASASAYTVSASATTPSGATVSVTPKAFSLTNTPGPFAKLVYISGSAQSATVGTAFKNPLIVEAEDQYGNGLVTNLPTVTFTAPTTGASATLGSTSAVSGQAGQVEVTATANKVASATAYTVSASATLPSGAKTTVTPQGFALTNTAGAAIVTANSGTPQTVTAPKAFAALVAKVADQYGNLISGAIVTFTANKDTVNGLYLATFANSAKTATATTNAAGLATAPTLTSLSISGGMFIVTASVTGASSSATFSLSVEINDPVVSPPQSATVGRSYAKALYALVTSPDHKPVAGVPVTFTAPASGPGGTFAGKRTVTVRTNAGGIATAPAFTANTQAGAFSVTVTTQGVPAPDFISLTNLAGPAAKLTFASGKDQSAAVNTAFTVQFAVRVTDAFGNAIDSAPVTFVVRANTMNGAAATFGGTTPTTATTDATGLAVAPPLKANGKRGSFSVIVSAAGVAREATFDLTVTN